jgi:hypothetical protein
LNRRFLLFWLAGIGVVAALIFFLFTGTKGAHLRLEGKILKVRVLPLTGSQASIVMVDFRATNPSDVPFVVSNVHLKLTPAKGDTEEGMTISKPDINNIFQYAKLLGPKFNDVLSLQDRIAPHQRADRMVGARFEVPESAVNARHALQLVIEDVDGTIAEITEDSAGVSSK